MAGELIGALRVALGLDTAQFEAGAKKARAEAKVTATSIRGTFSELKGAAAALATGLVATTAIAAAKRALDYASSLGEVAQQLGVTTKDLQVYRYAASQAGIEQDEMDRGLAKLTLSIGKAGAGSKKEAGTFAGLGISVRDAAGNVKTAGTVIPELADALAQIKDPATRARIEVELFGKTGQKLDTLLAGGRSAVDELTRAATRLGLVLSSEQIQKADDAADKLAAVKQVLEAKIAGVVSDNADAIVTLANAFGLLAQKAGDAAVAVVAANHVNRANNADLSTAERNSEVDALLATPAGRRARFEDLKQRRAREKAAFRATTDGSAASKAAFDRSQAKYQFEYSRIAAAARQSPSVPTSAGRGIGAALAGASKGASSGGGAARDEFADRLKEIRGELLSVSTGLQKATKDQAFLDVAFKRGALSAIEYAVATENLKTKTRDLLGDTERLPASILETGKSLVDADAIGERALAGVEFAAQKASDSVAQTQARVDDLATSLNQDLTEGLFGAIRGFNSLGDVALKVLDDIGQALISKLSPGGSGGIGGLLANAVLGGLGGGGSKLSLSALSLPSYSYNPANYGGSLPRFARGGTIGGFGGIDRNELSINGSPVARVGRGEMLRIEPDNDNSGRIAHIVPSPYFDVVVDGRIGNAAPAIVTGSSSGTQRAISRQNSRRLA